MSGTGAHCVKCKGRSECGGTTMTLFCFAQAIYIQAPFFPVLFPPLCYLNTPSKTSPPSRCGHLCLFRPHQFPQHLPHLAALQLCAPFRHDVPCPVSLVQCCSHCPLQSISHSWQVEAISAHHGSRQHHGKWVGNVLPCNVWCTAMHWLIHTRTCVVGEEGEWMWAMQ